MENIAKRRRILIDDDEDEEEPPIINDDDESVVTNPDELRGDQDDSDDEEGEDLLENWRADYAPAPELDYYDPALLAREDEVVETYEQQMAYRRAADEELDAERERRRRMEEEAEDDLEDPNDIEAAELDEYSSDDEDEDEAEDGTGERSLNLEAFQCPLREWIAEERTRREIKKRFRKFLLSYYENIDSVTRFEKKFGTEQSLPPHLKKMPPVYPLKIRAMCSSNKSSLEVAYGHLGEMQSLLAIWLTDVPRDMLQIFDEVLQNVVRQDFPHYFQICPEVHVRIIGLPLADRLRDLRQGDLNNLIRVNGVVTRRTGVSPQLKAVAYDCNQCGQILGPFKGVASGSDAKPSVCPSCQSTGPFKVNTHKSEYGNYQRLTLQESPGSVPPGRVPRYKDVVLLGDLVDIARPGEEIEVTGIYAHNRREVGRDRSGFPTFSTVIEANCVQKTNSTSNSRLSDEDKRRIRELGADPQIGERIFRSMAPSIYGHRHVKMAVALSLFGGCPKEGGGGGTHRVRGDINVLLLGDPGTAKSQMLKYVEKIAPRSVYATGKGASAVGLTAGVRRDPMTKEWTLEGGALVLADQGVCLIDEFDKMNDQDRTSIHEAMEQQTISVSKAGIVTSLQARCAVLAAANPISGRYDASYTLAENVELTDPILQRFDILCVLQDIVDPVVDEQLALFVVNSHMRSHPDKNPVAQGVDEDEGDDDFEGIDEPSHIVERNRGQRRAIRKRQKESTENEPQPLDQATLKKYITYARAYVKPILHDVDSEKIAALYAELRQQSAVSGGVPIAVRHIESVMRMAEASARMHLREHVRDDDVDLAIKVMLESFLQAQKVSVRKALQRSFRKYITYGEETNQLIMHQLHGLVLVEEKYKKIKSGRISDATTEVPIEDLVKKAKDLNVFDLRPFFLSSLFRNHGFHVDMQHQVIVKTY